MISTRCIHSLLGSDYCCLNFSNDLHWCLTHYKHWEVLVKYLKLVRRYGRSPNLVLVRGEITALESRYNGIFSMTKLLPLLCSILTVNLRNFAVEHKNPSYGDSTAFHLLTCSRSTDANEDAAVRVDGFCTRKASSLSDWRRIPCKGNAQHW